MRRALLVLITMLWMPATGAALTYYLTIRLRQIGSPSVTSPRPKVEHVRTRRALLPRRSGPFARPVAAG